MPQIICPVCDAIVKRSDYLQEEFRGDSDAIYAANLVTHYRHVHLKQYDYAWRNPKDRKTGYGNTEHSDFRSKINERAKKELIIVLVNTGKWEAVRGFLRLQDNDPELVKQINTVLDSRGKEGVLNESKVKPGSKKNVRKEKRLN